ncbi:hypothetical protein NCS57_00784500 [Fusarium keratoplasticum]|uniref:Uncharacterized protein n=1 Tax=Fusarium keratoplasticum TaxID=1328300 RepID=A0ACC0QXD2_9HYPO|nr:hypothetical protein NCS57_00784500 [Fusarium keratoplasticum]KAI8669686.1 hypothetical protein NCS57_00784500 [Fusarium keratoplasticum]
MDRWCRIVPFMVLAFQALILTTTAQAIDSEEFAYAEDSSTYRTLRCPISSSYSSSTTYIDDLKTYGFCYIGGEGYHQVDTSCRGSTVYYTGWSSGTTAGINSADEPETVTVTGSRRTLAGLPSSTSTDDSDSESRTDDTRPSEPGKGGPSPGVIAGAVIGALAGVALIAGALILGFRIGRQHPALDNQESGSKKTFRDTISSLPRPTIAWSRPNAKGTPERDLQNDVSVLQVNFSDDTTTKRASELPSPAPQSPVNQVQSIPPPISPQPYSTAAVESHRVELPTGLESQGWARSDAHPLPYEVDAQPQTHEVDGTPNNRTSSP